MNTPLVVASPHSVFWKAEGTLETPLEHVYFFVEDFSPEVQAHLEGEPEDVLVYPHQGHPKRTMIVCRASNEAMRTFIHTIFDAEILGQSVYENNEILVEASVETCQIRFTYRAAEMTGHVSG